jgi:hypothetical protein
MWSIHPTNRDVGEGKKFEGKGPVSIGTRFRAS